MIGKELKGVILALVLVVGVFGTSMVLFPNTSAEPFSAIALLGQNQTFASYPSNVTINQPFTLYVLVSNHEGSVEYYSVFAKLAGPSSVNDTLPLSAPVLTSFDRAIMNDQNYTWRGDFQLGNPGRFRLVFELWSLDTSLGALQYTGRFVQLWINVVPATV